VTAIITVRPPKGCQATIALGQRAGLDIAAHPLFTIAPRDWSGPPPERIDALLVGSSNAIEQAGQQLTDYRDKPVHAVGDATANAARAAGLAIASVGQGGLQRVLDALPAGEHRLLRLAGEVHVPLRRPAGVSIELRVVYAADPVEMDDPLAAKLRAGALVLLHSAEAARHFASECERHGIDKGAIALAALGPRILEAAGEGWAAGNAASQPRDTALLALAHRMWHR